MVERDSEYDALYKIVLVGESEVGKTNLLCCYLKGVPPKMSAPTIGVEFTSKSVDYDGMVLRT